MTYFHVPAERPAVRSGIISDHLNSFGNTCVSFRDESDTGIVKKAIHWGFGNTCDSSGQFSDTGVNTDVLMTVCVRPGTAVGFPIGAGNDGEMSRGDGRSAMLLTAPPSANMPAEGSALPVRTARPKGRPPSRRCLSCQTRSGIPIHTTGIYGTRHVTSTLSEGAVGHIGAHDG